MSGINMPQFWNIHGNDGFQNQNMGSAWKRYEIRMEHLEQIWRNMDQYGVCMCVYIYIHMYMWTRSQASPAILIGTWQIQTL